MLITLFGNMTDAKLAMHEYKNSALIVSLLYSRIDHDQC